MVSSLYWSFTSDHSLPYLVRNAASKPRLHRMLVLCIAQRCIDDKWRTRWQTANEACRLGAQVSMQSTSTERGHGVARRALLGTSLTQRSLPSLLDDRRIRTQSLALKLPKDWQYQHCVREILCLRPGHISAASSLQGRHAQAGRSNLYGISSLAMFKTMKTQYNLLKTIHITCTVLGKGKRLLHPRHSASSTRNNPTNYEDK